MERPELNTIKEELNLALGKILPIIEGLTDYGRLNLKESTKASVVALFRNRETRKQKLDDAMRVLKDLEQKINVLDEDGHPNLPKATIGVDEIKDLVENKTSIDTALAEFMQEQEAVGGNVQFSPTDQK